MSILIKGMTMPQNCIECPCYNDEIDICNITSQPIAIEDWHKRKADCPLIELPPHGRLIDADALRVDYFAPSSTSNMPNYYHVSKAQIDNAPTIIESEGEKNER